ncbi:MAG: hypothetical protein AAF997_16895 [Myxococcota bacterium]
MCLLASCGFLGLAGSGCVATDTIEFDPTENFPPSIISQPEALFPLDEIGAVNLDDPPPAQGAEVLLQTTIRDPNIEETLEFRLFVDDVAILVGDDIEPSGFVERDRDFAVPFGSLTPGDCHKVDLVVTSEFESVIDLREPLIPGDFDQAVWWIRVTNTEFPEASECQ